MSYKSLVNSKSGVTLTELLLVMGVLALMSGVMSVSLYAFFNRNKLELTKQKIEAAMENAQSRAIARENTANWGIHFVNQTNPDYYQLFYGSSYAAGTVVSITYLDSSVEFSTPGAGLNKDIIFSQSTGYPGVADSVVIQRTSDSSAQKTVSVSAPGVITSQ